MEVSAFLRVVVLRKGKLKSAEFRLREGETGLSLFARTDSPNPRDVLEAVRAAGKLGELAVAVLSAEEINSLGLMVEPSPGGTPSEEVNAVHYEAKLRRLQRLLLLLRAVKPRDYFNENLSPRLCAAARILE